MSDQESAGATPVEPGATPGQSGAQPSGAPAPAAATTAPEPDADGMATDVGRRLLRELRAQVKAQAAELEATRTSQLSEHEKAIAQARKEAAAEARTRADAMVRRAEVRRALQGAGVTSDALDLAAGAPDFAGLEVDDEGGVGDLEKTVDAFRRAHPSLFAPARAAAGNFDGGSGGSPAQRTWTAEQIGAMSQADFERDYAEISRAMREGRVRQT